MITFEALANIDSTQIFIALAFLTFMGILDINNRLYKIQNSFEDRLEDVETRVYEIEDEIIDESQDVSSSSIESEDASSSLSEVEKLQLDLPIE